MVNVYRLEDILFSSDKMSINKDKLLLSTMLHIQDVRRIGIVAVAVLSQNLSLHDWTKIKYYKEFYSAFNDHKMHRGSILESHWYASHISNEKHHVFDYIGHDRIDMFDLIELCCDWISASLAREDISSFKLDLSRYEEDMIKEKLFIAFKNTFSKLVENVRVIKAHSVGDMFPSL
jgi:hypothetical protein